MNAFSPILPTTTQLFSCCDDWWNVGSESPAGIIGAGEIAGTRGIREIRGSDTCDRSIENVEIFTEKYNHTSQLGGISQTGALRMYEGIQNENLKPRMVELNQGRAPFT